VTSLLVIANFNCGFLFVFEDYLRFLAQNAPKSFVAGLSAAPDIVVALDGPTSKIEEGRGGDPMGGKRGGMLCTPCGKFLAIPLTRIVFDTDVDKGGPRGPRPPNGRAKKNFLLK